MDKLTKLCLKKPVSTVIIIIALLIFGLSAIPEMNMQLTPDMEMPMILVYTVYPQASPEEVDELVSQELEKVGATIQGLESITSQSRENVSVMIYQFDYGTDIDEAYQSLQEEINVVKSNLPEDCQNPNLIIMDINALQSMTLSVTSKSGADVRTFVDDKLEPEILSIANVAQTDVSGGAQDYISVTVTPDTLASYGLNLSGISQAIAAADFSMPSGNVDFGNQVMDVSTQVEYKDIFDLENIPLTTAKGQMIRLSDVADVHYAVEKSTSVSRHNGSENVGLNITKQQGSNAVKLSSDVKKKIEQMMEKYPDMVIEVTYDGADTIIASLKSVAETMIAGVLLSMFVLFIFFGDIKASLIVGSSMPVSLLLTLILMHFAGYSLNILTTGAMVIGIGMIVDNSIVVLEMCFQKKEEGLSFTDAANDAVKTVILSITASTITTIVVYFPMATITGISGQLFGPLGFTIIFLLVASLICAITLVPLCFSKYCPIEKKDFPVNKFVRNFSQKYGNFMEKILEKKWLAIISLVVMVGVTVFVATLLNVELMPATDEGTVTMTVDVRPGLSIEVKDQILTDLEDFVSKDPDVESYDVSGSQSGSSLNVTAYLKEDRVRETKQVVDDWNQQLKDRKNVEIVCESSSSSTSGMSAANKTVVVKSRDIESLKEAANIVSEAVRKVEGVTDITTSFSNSSARADILINPTKAAAQGVSPAQAGGMLYAAKQGSEATNLTVDEKEYKVNVEYPDNQYDSIDKIMNMPVISATTGRQVIMSDIAEVVYTDSPQTIYRKDKYYTCDIDATLLSEYQYTAGDEIDAVTKKLELPRGVEYAQDTMSAMQEEAFGDLGKAIITAMFLVFMVMTIQFESGRYAGMIMFTIPFSLIGSVLLLFIMNATLSMVSLMGFLMLEGIVVNNGILFVDTANQFRESMPTNKALVAAGVSRLRPILMTTLTTILSMIPLAIGIGRNGQMMQGMAVVIIGGLLASTVLTLVFLPTFYLIIHRRSKAKKQKKAEKKKKRSLKKANASEDTSDSDKEASEDTEEVLNPIMNNDLRRDEGAEN